MTTTIDVWRVYPNPEKIGEREIVGDEMTTVRLVAGIVIGDYLPGMKPSRWQIDAAERFVTDWLY